MTEDVTQQTEVVEEPTQSVTEPTEQSEISEPAQQDAAQPNPYQDEINNLKAALRQEREEKRKLRELGQQPQQQPQQTDEDYQQELVTYRLRDVVDELFEKHNISPEWKKAIRNNPLGFIKRTTKDLENAKYDLQDFIEELATTTQKSQVEQPKPQPAPILGNNKQINESATDDIQALIQKAQDEGVDALTSEERQRILDHSDKKRA